MVDMPSSEFTTKMKILSIARAPCRMRKELYHKGACVGKSRTGTADTVTSVLHFYACTFFWTDWVTLPLLPRLLPSTSCESERNQGSMKPLNTKVLPYPSLLSWQGGLYLLSWSCLGATDLLFRDKGANSWDSLWAFWLAALKVLVLSMEGNNLQALSMLGHVNQN